MLGPALKRAGLVAAPALAAVAGPAGVASAAPPVTVDRTADQVVLANGFVRAVFDLRHPQLATLQADFEGAGNYGRNLTSGIVLERNDGAEHASSAGAAPGLSVTVPVQTADAARVQIDGVVDDVNNPLVTSTWTLALNSGSRALDLAVDAHALRAAPVRAVRLAYALAPTSVYGFFDRGATQRLASDAPYFASADHLQRFYALGGGGGAVDI